MLCVRQRLKVSEGIVADGISTSKASRVADSSIDDAFGFDGVLPLDADDAALAAAVQDADLPALLAALSVLTGDPALTAEDLVPPTPPMGTKIVPQGGMSPEAQAKAREVAVRALIRARDRGWAAARPSRDAVAAAIKFLTKGANEDYMPLLMREIGLPDDVGAPKWQMPELRRDEDYKVIVIGAGMAGVAAAYRLSQANVSYVVLEKSPAPGGVWWDNNYPGCRLDTPNFAYSFSFAQKPDWPQQFSKQSEILNYINTIVDGAGLRDSFEFSTEVVSMRYDADRGGWVVIARRSGEEKEYFGHAVLSALGHLNRPNVPTIPGQDVFSGAMFHSAEWPEGFDITGKRVGVIGTGASGFQIVPTIADQVKSLRVFQRNPAWMLNTPNYLDDIKPGMQWLLAHVPYYGRWFRFWQFWIAAEGRFPAVKVDPEWKHPISVSAANESLRQGCLEILVAQTEGWPDLREKLTPNYPPGAKRMVRDNGAYIATLKKPHVELVSTRIERLTETGIMTADGQHHDLDVIVYATGFHASDYLDPIEVIGRDGRNLHQYWDGDCRAYLGMSVPDFPNLFILGGPNSGLVVNGNAIFTAESALGYAISAIEYMLRNNLKAVDVKPDVYRDFNEEIDRENLKRTWGIAKVNTWYQGKSGRATVTWPYPILEYFKRTSAFNPEDYNLQLR
jgi:4-hydroxyacetophenone monooxygenase